MFQRLTPVIGDSPKPDTVFIHFRGDPQRALTLFADAVENRLRSDRAVAANYQIFVSNWGSRVEMLLLWKWRFYIGLKWSLKIIMEAHSHSDRIGVTAIAELRKYGWYHWLLLMLFTLTMTFFFDMIVSSWSFYGSFIVAFFISKLVLKPDIVHETIIKFVLDKFMTVHTVYVIELFKDSVSHAASQLLRPPIP